MTAEAFADAYRAGRPQVVSRRLIDDLETPVSAYLKVGRARPFAFLFESVEGGAWRGRYSILTVEPDLVWRCWGDRAEIARGREAVEAASYSPEPLPALDSLRALVAECRIDLPADLPPMAAGLFGVFGYDMVRLVEPVGPARPDPLNLPDAVWARPSVVAIFDGVAQEIILCTPVWPGDDRADQALQAAHARLDAFERSLRSPAPASGPRDRRAVEAPVSGTDEAAFATVVERAKGYIASGDIFQVVAGHRFEGPAPSEPFAFYRSLRRTNPSPFLFHLDFGDFVLAGSSPEILVRLRDGEVTIRPLAGTRPRGATPAEDARLEAELLADPKERAEHLMLLDLGRNDVGRVAEPGTVTVTKSFFVERYSHVMHIVSNVEGELHEKHDALSALVAGFPAGTVSGAPKVRAMQIIDELEKEKRGVYAGSVGYFAADGSMDTCIVLRTALVKDGKMYVQAGAGIVADSNPKSEQLECENKAKALFRAAEEARRFASAAKRGQ